MLPIPGILVCANINRLFCHVILLFVVFRLLISSLFELRCNLCSQSDIVSVFWARNHIVRTVTYFKWDWSLDITSQGMVWKYFWNFPKFYPDPNPCFEKKILMLYFRTIHSFLDTFCHHKANILDTVDGALTEVNIFYFQGRDKLQKISFKTNQTGPCISCFCLLFWFWCKSEDIRRV